MSLKLAKGWERATGSDAGNAHFRANSADFNAYVNLRVIPLGTGYTFEDWGKLIADDYSELAIDGAVETKKTSFAKQKALSFAYLQEGEWNFETRAYGWTRDGFGFLMSGAYWDEGPKKLKGEIASTLKSIKVARR